MTKEEATIQALDYIFETELDDFLDNPSENHIYYIALVASSGQAYGDKFLSDRLKELEE